MARFPTRRTTLMVVASAALAATLSGCGGMTSAVGVLPNTLDDLEAKSAAARGEEPLPPGCERRPCETTPRR